MSGKPMNDFLGNLIDRSETPSNEVRPRTPSLYEPLAFAPMLLTPNLVTHASMDLADELKSSPASHFFQDSDSQTALLPTPPEFHYHPQRSTSIANDVSVEQTSKVSYSTSDQDPVDALAILERKLDLLTRRISTTSAPFELSTPSHSPKIIPTNLIHQAETQSTSIEFDDSINSPFNASPVHPSVLSAPPILSTTPRANDLSNSAINQHGIDHSFPTSRKTYNPERSTKPTSPNVAIPKVKPLPTTSQVTSQTHTSHPVPFVNAPTPTFQRKQSSTPTVTVTIGRIELRGEDKTPNQPTPRPVSSSPSRVMSLEQYIALRSQGNLS